MPYEPMLCSKFGTWELLGGAGLDGLFVALLDAWKSRVAEYDTPDVESMLDRVTGSTVECSRCC